MKKLKISLMTLVAMAILAAATDPLQQLNLTRDDAQRYVFETISTGNLSFPATARTIVPSLRVDIAKGIAEFAKAYTQTSSFKTHYAEWWKSIEPHTKNSRRSHARIG